MPDNETNGDIKYYLVCYKVETSGDEICSKTKNVTGVDNTSTELNNLNKFTSYEVAVQAGTSKGAGEHGTTRTVKTLEDGKDNDLYAISKSTILMDKRVQVDF